MEKSELDRSEAEQRLVAMEQQVETLQRIVNLKDEQIAALQGALAETDGSTDTDGEALSAMGGELDAAPDVLEAVTDTETLDEEGMSLAEEVVQEEPESAAPEQPEPPVAVVPAPVASQPQPQESGGFMSNIMYILGAAVLAILGFIFMRRRGASSEEPSAPAPAPAEDAFADVQLKDQKLDVEAPVELEQLDEGEGALLADEEQSPPSRDSRGYGEHKHDEYASDVDTGDALAEADIYIAYGRYPQAIDLLNNAIGNEPNNPAYRLKLLEMHAEMGDRTAAMQQFSELQAINEPVSLARAQEVLDGLSASATVRKEEAPVDLLADTDAALEADFSGLEIEDPAAPQESAADDLDLTADFDESALTLDDEDGDLVIATESNGFSTKLDLARAYLDMGDEDGARQILEEVAADGSGELKAEAQELLERIG